MPILGVIASSDRNVPNAPTIGTATNVPSGRAFNNGRADVTFTAPIYTGGLPITSYTVTSSPGGFTGSGAASPISVTGLQSNQNYTFTVTATNAVGTGAASAASNQITATTVPQAPTIGTATAGNAQATVSFTANATGGATITSFTATSSPGGFTASGAGSPLTVTGLTNGTAYTFTVTATNTNGTSAASAASNSVTPAVPLGTIGTWSATTNYPTSRYVVHAASGSGSTWFGHGGLDGSSTSSTTFSYRWNDGSSTFTNFDANISSAWSNIAGDANSDMQINGTWVWNGATNPTQATTQYWTGSAWAGGTAMPIAVGASSAFGWGSNTFTVVGGYSSSTGQTNGNYYRTGTGSFSTGTTHPIATSSINSWAQGMFGYGKGYTFTQNSSVERVYSLSSTTSAFTAETDYLFATNQLATARSLNTLFITSGNYTPVGVYRWNGISTYTLQTSPTTTPSDLQTPALAGTSNKISLFTGWNTTSGGTAYNVHYIANVT